MLSSFQNDISDVSNAKMPSSQLVNQIYVRFGLIGLLRLSAELGRDAGSLKPQILESILKDSTIKRASLAKLSTSYLGDLASTYCLLSLERKAQTGRSTIFECFDTAKEETRSDLVVIKNYPESSRFNSEIENYKVNTLCHYVTMQPPAWSMKPGAGSMRHEACLQCAVNH
jgi:hypothetical protein